MKTIFIAGHQGMVGSALVRELSKRPRTHIITRSRSELDLTQQQEVRAFFSHNQIDEVYLAAGKVGGIYANDTYPAEFIYQNLMIQSNIIHEAHKHDVQKLLFLGSSCIYPKFAEQPIVESALLTGQLEKTNEPYAVAKIAGIKLCESYNRQYSRDYRSVMPTNLYGPNDNFHPKNSHVIPGLLRRFHEAAQRGDNEVIVWGSGKARRDFLHVDDLALACINVLEADSNLYDSLTQPMMSHINVGSGRDYSIEELVLTLAKVTNFRGDIVWDRSKPDGTLRKLMDTSQITALGWSFKHNLEEGLMATYKWYLNNECSVSK